MFRNVKGFAQFISAERGFMLFMISMGATFLIAENLAWVQAIYLGFIVFCGWSGADAINNICDVALDVKSDPFRAEYTKNLGRLGLFISLFFSALSISLGVITGIPLVTVFILVGIFAGVLYSVPPFRLRQTIYKPLVNFSVGCVPVLIVAAFFNVFSVNAWALMLPIGITTAVNSLWEDLADYASDFNSRASTMTITLGFERGLHVTIILGYCLIPLMVLVGILFHLNLLYYLILSALVAYMSLRLIQKRSTLFGNSGGNTEPLLKLGEIFAKDFVIIAIIQTTNLMLSGYLKHQPIFLF
ncbi:UbiA prenyltransferase family protein [Candidatus Bathyarchaeota archaeon]|nr:UbiA prenyltransferase family protein [Candidatus Bathyarchaeota archaeon]